MFCSRIGGDKWAYEPTSRPRPRPKKLLNGIHFDFRFPGGLGL